METLLKLINQLLQGAPHAQQSFKTMERDIKPEDSQKNITEIARLRVGKEAQHGMESFFNKETPQWKATLTSVMGEL